MHHSESLASMKRITIFKNILYFEVAVLGENSERCIASKRQTV